MRYCRLFAILIPLSGIAQNPQVPFSATLVRHDVVARYSKACPTLNSSQTATSLTSGQSQFFLQDTFYCDAVSFTGPNDTTVQPPRPSFGAATFRFSRAAIKGLRRATDNFISLDSTTPLEIVASFTGTANIAGPATREHNAWTDVKVENLPTGVTCPTGTKTGSVAAGGSGSLDMSATVTCSLAALLTLPLATGSPLPNEFDATVVTTIVVDNGHVGQRCCSQRGGKVELSIRSTFTFKMDVGDPPGQTSTAANRIKPVLPEQQGGFVSARDGVSQFLTSSQYTTSLVEEGTGLDTGCRFGNDGDLRVTVPVRRYVGETEGDGKLKDWRRLVANGVLAEYAVLTVAAYDVDDGVAATTDRRPELDQIFINGERLMRRSDENTPVRLRGFNNQWSVTRFLVPVSMLRFPAAPREVLGPAAANNELRIVIDVDNTSRNQWCTEVDWVSLSVAAMAPVVLVHSWGAGSGTWSKPFPPGENGKSVTAELEEQGVPYLAASLGSASAEKNAFGLKLDVIRAAVANGSSQVHIVGHGKGAIDARAMISRDGGKVSVPGVTRDVQILSLFALGSPSLGIPYSEAVQASKGILARLATDARDTASAAGQSVRRLIPDQVAAVLFWTGPEAINQWANWFTVKVDETREQATQAILAQINEDVKLFSHYWLGSDTAPRGDNLLSPAGMADFNDKHPKPAGVEYFSIAGVTDQNASVTVDNYDEISGFFSRIDWLLFETDIGPEALQIKAGDIMYQTIGRDSVAGFVNWTRQNSGEPVTEASPTFRPNDLVTTAESAHCASPCGFVNLGDFPLHHEGLKSPLVIRRVLDTIRTRFPLPR